jgi:DegV family protein with EDD domain
MSVKIVTDSVADIPNSIAENLGITVIPLNVHFGNETLRDGIDLAPDQFYRRLVESKRFPTTTVPPRKVYTEVYKLLAEEGDGIVVIAFSGKLGAGYDIALEAKKLKQQRCRVEVIDSQLAVMAQGLVVIAAARAALAGADVDEIVAQVKRNIPRTDVRMVFDTLEYMQRGGRIGKARVFLSSMLRVNPILGLKNGEVYPFSREHSRAKAVDYLYKFADSYSGVDGLAIEDATTPDEADRLMQRVNSRWIDVNIIRSKVSAVPGSHVGPHVLAVAIMGDRLAQDSHS